MARVVNKEEGHSYSPVDHVQVNASMEAYRERTRVVRRRRLECMVAWAPGGYDGILVLQEVLAEFVGVDRVDPISFAQQDLEMNLIAFQRTGYTPPVRPTWEGLDFRLKEQQELVVLIVTWD
jgi:hypothetical protein